MTPDSLFHPAVAAWFNSSFAAPTPAQLEAWAAFKAGQHLLIAARTVSVDEIPAMAASKRGTHLALSLERLSALCGGRVQRVGLSATQRPIDLVARFLVGMGEAGAEPACTIIDSGHRRARDL